MKYAFLGERNINKYKNNLWQTSDMPKEEVG